jgi:hypothetical protein
VLTYGFIVDAGRLIAEFHPWIRSQQTVQVARQLFEACLTVVQAERFVQRLQRNGTKTTHFMDILADA